MKQVKIIIKIRITDDNFNSPIFQEFIDYVKRGDLSTEMFDEELFESLKTLCFVNKLSDKKNPQVKTRGETNDF